MGAILLLVTALVCYACWRYRSRPGEETPRPVFGNLRLELAYTAAPIVLLGIILFCTVRTMQGSDPSLGKRGDDIVVVGHQWWWEMRYPAAGFVTANELHIPVDRGQILGLESADVIHDFWVPELGRKTDMTPGLHRTIWLGADQAGKYLGTCAEFCGAEHAWMRIRVIAQSKEACARSVLWFHARAVR